MAEFRLIDTSEDLIPVSRALAEQADNTATNPGQTEQVSISPIGHVLAEQADNPATNPGQTEQADKKNVPIAAVQEYVHKFKDGTVSTYALTEAKKCPVAGKMPEEQLMLILKFSALGMHSMRNEATFPKPAPPDRANVNPKTAQSGPWTARCCPVWTVTPPPPWHRG